MGFTSEARNFERAILNGAIEAMVSAGVAGMIDCGSSPGVYCLPPIDAHPPSSDKGTSDDPDKTEEKQITTRHIWFEVWYSRTHDELELGCKIRL